MATISSVVRVERKAVSEEELEAALRRILSVYGVYDGDEITRILRVPLYGFEFKAPEGQFICYALLTKIIRENPDLELGLISEHGKVKLAILNRKLSE